MKKIALGLFTFFACVHAFAQTTSSLGGVITSGGRPLEGVTITISSPALQQSRGATTGASGTYSFFTLPPGIYTVELTRDGMEPLETTAALRLAQETRVDAVMHARGATETITVTASTPSVLETTNVSTSMTLGFIERLPWQRNQLATAQLAPGVSGNTLSNGQLSIAGGPGYDNLVLVNGVSVTENVRGQMRPMYVEDAIQETTVLTGAISAEYGRFSGGVVSTITKSGGNELSASLRDSLSNPAWSSATPAGEARPDHLNHVWEATLGGAALRDRLWFFTAGRWAKNDTARQTLSVPAFANPPSAAGPALSYSESNDQKRYELKLTGALGARQTLAGSWFGIDTRGTNARSANNIYDEASLTTRDDPESFYAVRYDLMPSTNVLVEGTWSARRFSSTIGATTTDLIAGTVLLDRANNNARFHAPSFCAVCDSEDRDNDDVRLKAHAFFDTSSLGGHEVVAGVDRFTESRYANNHLSGSDFSLFVTRAQWNGGAIFPVVTPTNQNGGGTFIRWNPILAAPRANELRTDSAFANDNWTLGTRWTLSIGARFDRNHAVDGDGVVSSDDQKLSPRLAAHYDLRGDGQHRLSVSFAEYASRIADSIASSNQGSGNAASIDFAYRGPALNDRELNVGMDEVLRRVFDYFMSQQGGTANRAANNLRPNGVRSIPGYSTYFDGSLASPSVREMTVGYGAQFGGSGFARVDYIHRDWRDLYAASVTPSTRRENTPLGIPVDLSLIRNSNTLERRYRGVLLQTRWSPRRFDTGIHYTCSTLRGNDDGESGTTGAAPSVDPSLFYPEFFAYERAAPIGSLQGDQRHRLHAWTSYDVPLSGRASLSVSLLHTYGSGLAYSIAGPITLTRYEGAPANPGYASVPNGLYFFSERGALRTNALHSTDLALRHGFRIGAVELFAQGDVLNLFDRDAIVDPLRIGTTVSTAATSSTFLPFDPRTQAPIECPRGAAAATCVGLGAHYQLAANFGQPLNDLAYQRPRTVRVSVGARF